ncbi:hypothetical protein [Streptomyces deccanensis]|uniref:hypothetical protein n=1 Tax=Streptomyces deccanensis TaxID=424188 RepID=UPI001EFAF4E5|nr:hypothetical protein [Streptomyces deccanensis]ULR48853.1 hypothetical protein L3078_05990 [Streptomyces deccanensis]
MSDDLAFSADATPPWLRPEVPEHLRPLAAPPRPDRPPAVPDQRDTDAAPPPASTTPPAAPAPWASAPAHPPGQPAPEPVTRRLRRTVTDLPAWEPLPPGEQLVRRPSRDL